MAWNGYRGNESDIGDGIDALENCSLYTDGECIRRLGFGAKVDLSAAVVVSAAELGVYAVCATAAGAVMTINQSTNAVASLATGLDVTNRPAFAAMNGRLYYTNGVDSVRVSDAGTNFRTVGIAAPASAATATPTGSGGVVDAGVHLFRYRYYDSTRNRLSNPSVAVSATVTAGQTVTVGYAASGDATVDKIIIEATPAGAETYYRAATITNSGASTSFNTADYILIVGVPASRDGEFGHEQPATGYPVIFEHRQRLWMWKPSTGYLVWSRALYPESWDAVNYGRVATLNDADIPVAGVGFYSDIYLIGERSMRRFVYASDPAAAMMVDVPGNFGVFNQRCVMKLDGGTLIGWGKNGIWTVDAMQPKKVSRPVDDLLVSLVSSTNTTSRWIGYEPIRSEVAFFFPLSGETYCKAALVWSIDTNEWTLWQFRQAMSAGVMNTSYSDRQRLMVCDANGYAWRMGTAANDGGGDGSVVATSGSTTSVVNCVNTATPGQTAYIPSTGEERLITVANASSITVTPALANAPTTGTPIFIGSIRQRVISDWNPGDGINGKKRPTKLMIAMRPEGDMGEFVVNYYTDFSATKEVVSSFAADTFPQGVAIANNQITIDADVGGQDGFIPVPTPSEWKRVIRYELIAEEPLDGIRLLDVSFRNDSSEPSEEE